MRRKLIPLFLPIAIILSVGISHAASWKCKAVDKGVDGGSVETGLSIAVTSDGRPHIAYEYRIDLDWNVRYAYKDETGWHIEGIAQGASPSLVLNPAGNPRIGYGYGKLFYVYNDGIDWASNEAIPNPYAAPNGVSLKLGSTSQGCMSYVCSDNATLQYVYQDGSGWHPVPADDPTGKGTEGWTSLALAGGSTPHIAYGQRDGDDHNLRHAWWNGTVWTHETVDAVGNAGEDYSPLVLDQNGKLQIAYWQTGGASNLLYAWKTGEGWQKETVAGGLRDGEGYVGLAVDSTARPAVAYPGGTTYGIYYQDLKFAYRDDSGWHAETVDNYFWGGLSLAMDGQNRPHIAYSGPCGLMYATPGSGLVINSEVPRIDLTYIDFETSINWSFPGISGRVDAYMAVRLPDGTLLFFDPQLQLTPAAVPVARGVTVGGDARGWLLLEYWFIPPKGTYTLMAVCVPAGKSVFSSANWLGEGIDEDTLVVDYETPWWW